MCLPIGYDFSTFKYVVGRDNSGVVTGVTSHPPPPFLTTKIYFDKICFQHSLYPQFLGFQSPKISQFLGPPLGRAPFFDMTFLNCVTLDK